MARGMLRRRAYVLGLITMGIALSAGGSASAAVQVGQTFDPTPSCLASASGTTYVQRQSPDNRYVVPSNGVITSWSYHVGAAAPSALKLKVLAPAPGPGLTAYTTVADSAAPPGITPNGINSFTAGISVRAGDVLGLFVIRPSAAGCPIVASPGHAVVTNNSDPPPGTTLGYSAPIDYQLNVSAVLEPDCDNDGLGDETQDQDLRSCPPGPMVTITGQPKDKIKTKKKRAKATFAWTSSEEGAAFDCVLDGQQEFKACTSPLTTSVNRGEHTFSVTATDAGGNAGGAATDTFKVKRKKKRK